MSYIGNEPIVSATRTVTEVTATAGQTVFNANGGYTVGYLDVFLNGSKLTSTDFTATNGSSITLTEAAQVGDIVRLEAWGTFSTSNLVSPNYTGTLTGGTGVVNIGSGQVYKDASGNVGIGTSSPTKRLELGSLGAFRMQTGSVTMDCTPTPGGIDGFVWNQSVSTGYYDWATAGNVRMRLDTSGNLLVNTTSQYGNGVLCINTYRGGAVTGLMTQPSTNANYDAAGFRNSSGTLVGYIGCTASATSYVTSSDYRLKENIAPMTGALAKVAQLKPCTYTWKTTGEEAQGFIAHELAEVVPDCVSGEKDAVDEEGNPQYQGIDTSFLVATLTAAIQEQQALIQSQADTITAMEAQLTNINLTVADATARLTALEGKQ